MKVSGDHDIPPSYINIQYLKNEYRMNFSFTADFDSSSKKLTSILINYK